MIDPWGDSTNPDSGFNPWTRGTGTKTGSRAPWRPNTAKYVLTTCGHVALEWEISRTLQKLAPVVYCDDCDTWVTYERIARYSEIFQSPCPPQELPIDPPF